MALSCSVNSTEFLVLTQDDSNLLQGKGLHNSLLGINFLMAITVQS